MEDTNLTRHKAKLSSMESEVWACKSGLTNLHSRQTNKGIIPIRESLESQCVWTNENSFYWWKNQKFLTTLRFSNFMLRSNVVILLKQLDRMVVVSTSQLTSQSVLKKMGYITKLLQDILTPKWGCRKDK
ncbi:hypothetical protein OSB04_019305 [Centaurea solstitialis]|uniref:Uncharacterized protein n=1 Tax=Centaurea solstitialis TaxID=347529 RepID=A0AA38T8J3_9ASTR|nr:hypothetical protein OSB04_019305 [Centaurea solstitialis]